MKNCKEFALRFLRTTHGKNVTHTPWSLCNEGVAGGMKLDTCAVIYMCVCCVLPQTSWKETNNIRDWLVVCCARPVR